MSARFATQNLLALADKAATGRAEVWCEVEDLATLVDAAVFQDTLSYLDRGDQWHSHRKGMSELIQYLLDESIVVSTFPSESEQRAIANIATGHLVAFLGTDRVGEVKQLVEEALTPTETSQALGLVPDTWDDFDIGQQHLTQLATGDWDPVELLRDDAERRGSTFVVRSFLYVALANIAGTPLVPDNVRVPFIEMAARRHELLRERALESMASSVPRSRAEDVHQRAVDAPFASIVFSRCEGRLDRLAEETRRLRDELAPTRSELRSLELKAFGTDTEAKEAKHQFDLLIGQLDRNLGEYPGRRLQPEYFDIAYAAAEVAVAPESPAGWVRFFSSLPLDGIVNWWRRRPLIEIHRLRDERPGMEKRIRDISQLFGVGP